MGICKENSVDLQSPGSWQQAQRILEVLASLSYRAGEIDRYLHQIACGVSQLVGLDWSVVTICQDGKERVMASSLDLGEGDHIYSLHGLLTDTVVQTGRSLAVEDAKQHPEYGRPPEGYISYLGVPLRTPQGEILGTICSFCNQSRSFSVDEVRTVELFAERAATAIDNFRLYQQQQQFNEALEVEVAKRTEELKAAQVQLIEQERLAAVGQFAAMIVHEIRNPMTTIRMGLNYFKKTHLSEPEQERLSLSLDEVNRLENLLREILLYAKPQVLQLTELDVNELISTMLVSLREMPEAVDRLITFVPSESSIDIKGDKDKLKQVMINLVRNACEAIAPVEVVTCSVEKDDPDHIWLRVHNGGTPISPDVLARLTEPFYSTKSGGTGLGLAIVKRIIEAHKGTLLIQSDPVTGTVVSIRLPIASRNSIDKFSSTCL
ncbi:MAG: GAF domain-containing protein [Cyanobacteria bacterium RU_5_0]|nr:GAF domain-containing protein [Cyanobacteria bacterium RU_5_0]